MKDLLVAVSYNEKKTCKEIYKVLNVDEQTFKKLVNEKNAYKVEKEKALNNQATRFNNLNTKVAKHDLLLAKSIYDNFVDRGLIEDDEELQKNFFDYVLGENKEFKIKNELFMKILNKIRGN